MPSTANTGTVVLSIDAELGWGHHDLDEPPPRRVEYARTGWRRLVDLLDQYELPATWAIVGHLFLDTCDGVHEDHPTPPGWFERERTTWSDRPDLRFGQGLIEYLESAAVSHEVADHSFSHVLFDDPSTTPAVARAELTASADAANRSFDTFVYPRNRIAHRDILAEAGYTCYRGLPPTAPSVLEGRLGKVARSVLEAPVLGKPTVDEYGLVNVPASLFLFSFEGLGRSVAETLVEDPIVRQVRAGVRAAAREGETFHLWLHPNNLWADRHARRLNAVFDIVSSARDAGAVTVEPMVDVAERVLASTETPHTTPASP